MPKRRIYSEGFTELHADEEEFTALIEEAEDTLDKMAERHGVTSWEELPDEVLESLAWRLHAEVRESEIPSE